VNPKRSRLVLLVAGLVVLVGVSAAYALTPRAHTSAGNRAAATREATKLLATIQLPPSATESATDPTGSKHELSAPSYDENTPNLVDKYSWWTTPGQAGTVLKYIASHLPKNAKLELSGGSSPGSYQMEGFSLGSVPGVLGERVIAFGVVQLNHTTTAVRTDGEAVWITPRPQWERIPSVARTVTFTAIAGGPAGELGARSVPREISGGRARKLISLINRLELMQPGVYSCPAEFAESVSLRFLNAAGRVVARAVEGPTGCATVTLTIGRRVGPALDDSPSVTTELERLNAIPLCRTAQLATTAGRPQRDGRSHVITFSFRNRSRSVCRVSGFAKVRLLGAGGQPLPTKLRDQGAGAQRALGLSGAVPLDPGQIGQLDVSWAMCHARTASSVRVRLPGETTWSEIRTGSAAHPVAPCGGRLDVDALRPPF
jgi:hypothetical protein